MGKSLSKINFNGGNYKELSFRQFTDRNGRHNFSRITFKNETNE